MLSLTSPYPFFTDKDGDPLDGGYIYVGEVNQNPETAPVDVFWDEALTQPAAQPLRTLNGYIVRNGTPARVYVEGDDFSMTLKNKRGVVLFYERSVAAVSGLRDDLANQVDPTKGAAMIGFNAGYAGEQGVSLSDLLAQSVSVLQFCEGSGDETAQFAAAMATGKSLYIPDDITIAISDEASFAADNQIVWGGGTLQQLSDNKRILVGSSKTGVGVKGITLKPGPDHTGSGRSDAVSLVQCDRWLFEGVTVDWTGCTKAHHGLRVISSNYGKAIGNNFLNAPDTNDVYFTAGGGDIVLEENSSYNEIKGNQCISGNVYGINLTQNTSGGTMRGNQVIGNRVHNCTAYGIILYRSTTGTTADFSHNIIAYNDVDNITGGAKSVSDASPEKWFGAGIYDASSAYPIIHGNTVRNTCQQTNAGSLPMAGISSSSVTTTLTNNVVETSGKLGIYFSSGNATSAYPAPVDAVLTMANNKVRGCANEAYKIYNARRLLAHGNAATASGSGAAFLVDTNGDWRTKAEICGLILDNVQSGISINQGSIVSIQNAHVENSTSTGINLGDIEFVDLGGGSSVKSITGNGISISANVNDGVIDDILIVSETGYGVVAGGNVKIGDEVVFGSTGLGRYVGDYGGDYRTLANSSAPSVKNAKRVITGGTTTILGFTSGQFGQEIVLRSAHTVTLQNGGTLILKGGANANLVAGNIVTLICNTAGNWEEVSRNF